MISVIGMSYMKLLSPSLYGRKFRGHVRKFMDHHGLWPGKVRSCWVALSGGVDSMSLLHVLLTLRRERGVEIKAFSIDHCHRSNSGEDVAFCRNQCERLGVPFKSFQLTGGIRDNLEHRWRQMREGVVQEFLSSGEILYQGHHLDDSFEWYLLGQLKSSSREIPGIPLVNAYLRRPFLCVSKSQILRYAREEGVPFVFDKTNQDPRFERNDLRQSIAYWQQRFPKYLKHYALRQNDWAHLHSCHVLKKEETKFLQLRDVLGGSLFCALGQERSLGGVLLKKAVLEGLHKLSCRGRGVLSKEVDKLLAAVERGEKWGPMVFSGGVLAYWERNMIYLLPKSAGQARERMVEKLLLQEKVYGGVQDFREFYVRSPEYLTFPLLLCNDGEKTGLRLPSGHPLYRSLMKGVGEGGVWTSPLRLMSGHRKVKWPLKLLEYRPPC